MPRVIVAGSINMDVVARAGRLPQPGETIQGSDLQFLPGGKGANQAIAAARLGVSTKLLGCIGNDLFGDELRDFLESSGVVIDGVRRVATATGTALIVVSNTGENSIVVVPGANEQLLPADVENVECEPDSVLVSQFEIPLPTIEAFFRQGKRQGTFNILNPAPAHAIPRDLMSLTDVIVLNESELQLLTSQSVNLENGASCCSQLRAFDSQVVVLTLGKDGVIAVEGEREYRVPGINVEVVDTTGAGDCFVGVLASRLAIGQALQSAIQFANRAAALSVQRRGAAMSMPTLTEVEKMGG